MTEELSRTSALADRHTALGSGLEDWNGMGTAWSYSSDPNAEHDAVREHAGMFDMSPLKKVFVSGKDAELVLDHLTTRDISKITPGKSAYLSVLTEDGTMADDAILSNNGNGEWMIVHGSGDTMNLLMQSAMNKEVAYYLDDDLHNVSVQGPKALGILNTHCKGDLESLAYFEHMPTELFGKNVRVSRTGYSGERGYEIFAAAKDVGDIWDSLANEGVMPCSFASLDKVRIEAGLLFYGYDMTTDHTPYEVGLGFTVNEHTNYRGKKALAASTPKIQNVGLIVDHHDMVNGEEVLSLDGKDVGVVNSPCHSHRLGQSLALGHIDSGIKAGTTLQVKGDGLDTTAVVATLPFYDPDKSNTHAK